MTLNPINISLLTLCLLATANVSANPHDGKPPQEAIEACINNTENSQVSFETPRGDTLEATCKIIDGELVAVPTNKPNDKPPARKQRN